MSHYENLSTPPQDALKPIGFGNLKGKSDINPQWRYEALTKEYGDCGVGWKFEIVNTIIQPVPETKELMVFVQVNFYTKNGEEWSAPVPGFGGDFLIKKDKNGFHGNDEAYKMATTDALGTAAKMVGVAADIYRGKLNDGRCDTKYNRRENEHQSQNTTTVQTKDQATIKEAQKKKILIDLAHASKGDGLTGKDIALIIAYKFGKESSNELTLNECAELKSNYMKYWQELQASQKNQDDEKLTEGMSA